jgi:epoxyqueuosine reductase
MIGSISVYTRSEISLRTETVIAAALQSGFDLAGVAPAGPVEDFSRYRAWVDRGMAGEMRYLADHRAAVRADVRNLLASARSVICVAKRYNTAYEPREGARISRYAAGLDYHDVLRDDLQRLVKRLQALEPFEYKICVDTAPLLERSLARQAGLGWIGRNTCLINEPLGSWFFLGEIVTSIPLETGTPPQDRCGTCMRCVEACPTDAIVRDGNAWVVDSRRCISYVTIELRGPIPGAMNNAVGDHVFGCDICQEVCPWNSHAPVSADARFAPQPAVSLSLDELAELTPEEFRTAFAHTPVSRAKHAGLVRNANLVRENRGATA